MVLKKLFRTLSSLNNKEFKRFEQYVYSPFFSKHQDTIDYFDLIKEHYPEFEEKYIDNELIFSQLYPDHLFDDNKVRTLKKYLLKLAYDFLVQLQVEADTQYKQRNLLFSLSNRKLNKDFRRVYKESEKLLSNYPYKDELYFYDQFFLRRLQLHDHMLQENRLKGMPINQILSSLNKTTIIHQLNYGCAAISQRQSLQGEDIDSSFLRQLIMFCGKYYEALPILGQAYYLCYLLLSEKATPQTLDQLEYLLSQHAKTLEPTHMQNLYKHAINYCNAQYLTGKEVYLKRMLELYRRMLAYDLLYEEKTLPTHHYKNIVTLGLRLNEIDWTEFFINQYKYKIAHQFRDGVYNYNLANLYAYQGKYSLSLKHLQKVDFIDPFYRISYNILLLKIYYECNEIEAFLALSQSFRTYIRRKKELPRKRQLSYTNFAKYLRSIFMVKIGKKHNLPLYKENIEKSTALIEKGWLIQKIEEL